MYCTWIEKHVTLATCTLRKETHLTNKQDEEHIHTQEQDTRRYMYEHVMYVHVPVEVQRRPALGLSQRGSQDQP